MVAPVLVTGPTGNVGAPVVRELRAAGVPVRAAMRSRDPTALPSDVEQVHFDFADASSWASAFAGVQRMFLMRPPQISNVKRDLLPAVAAARTAGVRHVVFLSLQGAERLRVVPHAAVETWLRTSGLDWTFVRASFFMQNLTTTHLVEIRDEDRIVVPAGRGRTAFVDADDVAAVAAAALIGSAAHRDRAWTPTGPAALTYEEVTATLTTVLGRTITYARPGLPTYVRHARGDLQMPWGMVAVTSAIYSTARFGQAAGLTDDVRTVLGREPRTFAEFAQRERAAWERPAR